MELFYFFPKALFSALFSIEPSLLANDILLILIEYSSISYGLMPYFRISHLTLWQTYIYSIGGS